MAAAVATLTRNPHPNGTDNTQRQQIVIGTCALSASGTYTTNGVPLTWSGVPDILQKTPLPLTATFFTTASGLYDYWWDQVHNTLRIKLGAVELTNNAAITVDTIGFTANFVRGV